MENHPFEPAANKLGDGQAYVFVVPYASRIVCGAWHVAAEIGPGAKGWVHGGQIGSNLVGVRDGMFVHALPVQISVGGDALSACGWKVDDGPHTLQLLVDGGNGPIGCPNGPHIGSQGDLFDANDPCDPHRPECGRNGDAVFQLTAGHIGQDRKNGNSS